MRRQRCSIRANVFRGDRPGRSVRIKPFAVWTAGHAARWRLRPSRPLWFLTPPCVSRLLVKRPKPLLEIPGRGLLPLVRGDWQRLIRNQTRDLRRCETGSPDPHGVARSRPCCTDTRQGKRLVGRRTLIGTLASARAASRRAIAAVQASLALAIHVSANDKNAGRLQRAQRGQAALPTDRR